MVGEPARQILPAREGRALRLAKGQCVRLINTHGTQVVDCWAFMANDPAEFMSMAHSRVGMGRVNPRRGDRLLSNHRRAILSLIEDTSPGVHDTLIAACDRYRYEQLGAKGPHANCTDNLRLALGQFGMVPPATPAPLNLFMNIPIAADGAVRFEPTLAKPGDCVTLQAEQDVILVFSACPQDMVPINGRDMVPRDAHYEILS
ncbi:MAG: urea carboxylase-associated family protein [Alphaproteobacteria bacterium]|nr:urea carboxylase-associated family protein [Alphaproteobacteria bacterium]